MARSRPLALDARRANLRGDRALPHPVERRIRLVDMASVDSDWLVDLGDRPRAGVVGSVMADDPQDARSALGPYGALGDGEHAKLARWDGWATPLCCGTQPRTGSRM